MTAAVVPICQRCRALQERLERYRRIVRRLSGTLRDVQFGARQVTTCLQRTDSELDELEEGP